MPDIADRLEHALVGSWRSETPDGLFRQEHGRRLRDALAHRAELPEVSNGFADSSDCVIYSLGEDHRYERSETPQSFVQSAITRAVLGKLGGTWSVQSDGGGAARLELRCRDAELPALPWVGRAMSALALKPAAKAGRATARAFGWDLEDKYESPFTVELFDVIELAHDAMQLRFAGFEQQIRWTRIRGPVIG
ncbi:MAG: hypothetical protein QOG94_481 [Solirubrobacteraceae bacterium]|nr:hypothetical protein [Solirubrobacteraceae bacterium]